MCDHNSDLKYLHNDDHESDDVMYNIISLISKYDYDIVDKELNSDDFICVKRLVMMSLERWIDDYRNDLDAYISTLAEFYTYRENRFTYTYGLISNMYFYRKRIYNLRFYCLDTDKPDIYDKFVVDKVLSNDVLNKIVKETSTESRFRLDEEFINELTYDNILDIVWLTNFIRKYASNKELAETEIKLHREKVDNYG